MTFPNHIIGGVVLTGIFAAMVDINVLSSVPLIGVCAVASVLPDIDHTKSPIGKAFYPLAKWLNLKFGHRTITHSLIFFFALLVLVMIVEGSVKEGKEFTTVFGMAYFSHLLLDMMTVQGIPLFYPFKKNACVIPGRKDMRFRTGNPKSEISIFSFFVISLLFFQPLMEGGFWTTYNSLFGTPKHVANEHRRSEDLLEIDFKIKEGTEFFRQSGFVIEASEHQFVIIDTETERLRKIDTKICSDIIPIHTGRKVEIETKSFAMISVDSLNELVSSEHLKFVQIASNQSFKTNRDNYAANRKSLSIDYISDLHFENSPDGFVGKQFVATRNPHIEKAKRELELEVEKQRDIEKANASLELDLSFIEDDLFSNDMKVRQFAQEREKELRKGIKQIDQSKIERLKWTLQALRESDRQKNELERIKTREHNAAKPTKPDFSGTIQIIKISQIDVLTKNDILRDFQPDDFLHASWEM